MPWRITPVWATVVIAYGGAELTTEKGQQERLDKTRYSLLMRVLVAVNIWGRACVESCLPPGGCQEKQCRRKWTDAADFTTSPFGVMLLKASYRKNVTYKCCECKEVCFLSCPWKLLYLLRKTLRRWCDDFDVNCSYRLVCLNTEPPVGNAVWRGWEVFNWSSLAGRSRLLMGGLQVFSLLPVWSVCLPSPLIVSQPKFPCLKWL